MKSLHLLIATTLAAAALAWIGVPSLGSQAHAQSSDATPLYPQAAFGAVDGAGVYHAICQSCHMPNEQGAKGAGEYPALAGNPKLAAAPYVAMMVLNGHGGMPGFADMLNDKQISEVVQYVRTHNGNNYTDVLTADDVHGMRH